MVRIVHGTKGLVKLIYISKICQLHTGQRKISGAQRPYPTCDGLLYNGTSAGFAYISCLYATVQMLTVRSSVHRCKKRSRKKFKKKTLAI